MQVQENISLKPYNTFGLEARTKYFAGIESADDLQEILASGFIPPQQKSQKKRGGVKS